MSQKGLVGFDDVLKRMNLEISGIKNRGFDGLLEAGLKIQAASNKRAPRDLGNLVGSSYARKAQDKTLSVEVGYGASYAAALHENLEMKLKGSPRKSGRGVYWGPNGESKFLEKTVRDNEKAIVQIVAKRAETK
jgi:hypothetical protein